jgi:pimeloyl-ACP methyl ester carboxylesterase
MTALHTHYTSMDGYQQMMDWYDRALAQLAVSCTSAYIKTRYGKTHILTAGSPYAPPLVLVHGINVSALNWKTQIAHLAPYFRLIVPDVVGFAGRSAPTRLSYQNEDYAHWLKDVLDALGVEQALLAGSSGGGYFVLKFAAIYPEYVSGLVLINPCGLSRFRYPYDLGRMQWVVHLVGALGRSLANDDRAQRLVGMSASPGVNPDGETVEMAYLLLKYFHRQAPPGALPEHELRRVTAPVLLLLGEHEPYFNIHYLERQAQRKLVNVTQLETIIIPNAGHDIHNDQAEIVSDAIIRHSRSRSILTKVKLFV